MILNFLIFFKFSLYLFILFGIFIFKFLQIGYDFFEYINILQIKNNFLTGYSTNFFFETYDVLLSSNTNFYSLIIIIGVILFLIGFLLLQANLLNVTFYPNATFDSEKYSPYECGFAPFWTERSQFDIKFYLIALLFLVFDVEFMFLLPYVLAYFYLGFLSYLVFLIFFSVLLVGFIVEWALGMLTWKGEENIPSNWLLIKEIKFINKFNFWKKLNLLKNLISYEDSSQLLTTIFNINNFLQIIICVRLILTTQKFKFFNKMRYGYTIDHIVIADHPDQVDDFKVLKLMYPTFYIYITKRVEKTTNHRIDERFTNLLLNISKGYINRFNFKIYLNIKRNMPFFVKTYLPSFKN
jgi:NADH-quinone oxidoreductase subunit A